MLKSVRVYFNTKRMSAILKALQNRTVNVELKSEVVELGVADDISKKLGDMKSLLASMQTLEKESLASIKIASEAEAKKDKVLKANGAKAAQGVAAAEKAQSILDKAEKAANDLGVNPTSIKGYSELESAMVDVADTADEVEAIAKRGY